MKTFNVALTAVAAALVFAPRAQAQETTKLASGSAAVGICAPIAYVEYGASFVWNKVASTIPDSPISGTWVARKAGLTAKQIFNTKPVEEVAEYLAARRKKALAKVG